MDTFVVDLDHDRGFVRATATGDVLQRDGERIITTARTTAAEYGYSVLYDMQHATPRVPLSNWFHLPRELAVLKDSKTRYIKAAIVISADAPVAAYEFYELVAQNLGLSVRIFFSEGEAVAWLAGEHLSDDKA